MKWTLQEEEDP